MRHLGEVWGFVRDRPGEFVEPVLPANRLRGTADAVAQSLDLLDSLDPDLVAVFAADHVYRMDVRQMAAFHVARGADVTVAALPIPIAQASEFGILSVDGDGRVTSFAEKPAPPTSMPGDPGRALASMGNYLFRPNALRRALAEAVSRGEYDFGRHVLPRLVDGGNFFAYDFSSNRVPGLQPWEDSAYWRDVGTMGAFVSAQEDVFCRQPSLSLDNSAWPIHCGRPSTNPAQRSNRLGELEQRIVGCGGRLKEVGPAGLQMACAPVSAPGGGHSSRSSASVTRG